MTTKKTIAKPTPKPKIEQTVATAGCRAKMAWTEWWSGLGCFEHRSNASHRKRLDDALKNLNKAMGRLFGAVREMHTELEKMAREDQPRKLFEHNAGLRETPIVRCPAFEFDDSENLREAVSRLEVLVRGLNKWHVPNDGVWDAPLFFDRVMLDAENTSGPRQNKRSENLRVKQIAEAEAALACSRGEKALPAAVMRHGREIFAAFARGDTEFRGETWSKEHGAALKEKLDEIFNRTFEKKIGTYLKKALSKRK